MESLTPYWEEVVDLKEKKTKKKTNQSSESRKRVGTAAELGRKCLVN